MTDKEKAIIMAHTGITMLTGDKFSIFHKYIEDILGRSVWTHELADRAICEEIKEKSKADFLEICAEDEPEGEWARHDEWVNGEYVGGFYHVNCTCEDGYFVKWRMKYCGNCGAPMKLDDEEEGETDGY